MEWLKNNNYSQLLYSTEFYNNLSVKLRGMVAKVFMGFALKIKLESQKNWIFFSKTVVSKSVFHHMCHRKIFLIQMAGNKWLAAQQIHT